MNAFWDGPAPAEVQALSFEDARREAYAALLDKDSWYAHPSDSTVGLDALAPGARELLGRYDLIQQSRTKFMIARVITLKTIEEPLIFIASITDNDEVRARPGEEALRYVNLDPYEECEAAYPSLFHLIVLLDRQEHILRDVDLVEITTQW